jgi:hypothetical protein
MEEGYQEPGLGSSVGQAGGPIEVTGVKEGGSLAGKESSSVWSTWAESGGFCSHGGLGAGVGGVFA